jgi:excisionase family DNA binding protein
VILESLYKRSQTKKLDSQTTKLGIYPDVRYRSLANPIDQLRNVTPMTTSSQPTPHKLGPSSLPKPVWVTPNEAIRISGIGRTLLYELIKKGTLRSIRVGGKRLVSYASIETLGQ